MANSYIGSMWCFPLRKWSMSLSIEAFNLLYLQHVCDCLKSCQKKSEKTTQGTRSHKINKLYHWRKLHQWHIKSHWQTSVWMIRKPSRSRDCNISEFHILRKNKTRLTLMYFFSIEVKKQKITEMPTWEFIQDKERIKVLELKSEHTPNNQSIQKAQLLKTCNAIYI